MWTRCGLKVPGGLAPRGDLPAHVGSPWPTHGSGIGWRTSAGLNSNDDVIEALRLETPALAHPCCRKTYQNRGHRRSSRKIPVLFGMFSLAGDMRVTCAPLPGAERLQFLVGHFESPLSVALYQAEVDADWSADLHPCSRMPTKVRSSFSIAGSVPIIYQTVNEVRAARHGLPPLSGLIATFRWVTPRLASDHSSCSNVVLGGLKVNS